MSDHFLQKQKSRLFGKVWLCAIMVVIGCWAIILLSPRLVLAQVGFTQNYQNEFSRTVFEASPFASSVSSNLVPPPLIWNDRKQQNNIVQPQHAILQQSFPQQNTPEQIFAQDSRQYPRLGFTQGTTAQPATMQPWSWTLLPSDLLYKSYLAGEKESRISGVILHERGRGWIWDIALGGRMGIARYGSRGNATPSGWQLDIEGAAFPRLDFENNRDLEAADFRFGVPLTWSQGAFQTKLAYYHISDHIGDEYLERVSGSVRRNYSRDAIVLGGGYFPLEPYTKAVRLYAEIAYAFYTTGGAQPWEIQFGAEYTPDAIFRNGAGRGPFAAINVHLREELDWGGSMNMQAGWMWKGAESHHTFRAGFQYRTGATNQYTFLGNNEQQFGVGLWYDY